ncbi:acetoacetate decarboxylase family protein [Acidovorax sp. PRC11]|nr:acetoacetate decarboxylase family protein [Acidovorax sp. PRC11]
MRTDSGVEQGAHVPAMYLGDHPPMAGGGELWGFPNKLAHPAFSHEPT